jgi:Ca2+-binding EF-hand superfamily protein
MKKLLCTALVAAGLAATTLATPAFADDDATKAKVAKQIDKVFARLDNDNDSKISKSEASKGPRLSKHFDAIDTNHDGFVTRAELAAAFAARHADARRQP